MPRVYTSVDDEDANIVRRNLWKLLATLFPLNLRRLTRRHDTASYLKMMDRAHAFSHWLEPSNYGELKAQLERSNAFEEEDNVLIF